MGETKMTERLADIGADTGGRLLPFLGDLRAVQDAAADARREIMGERYDVAADALARLESGATRVRAAPGGGWREGPPDAGGWYFVEDECGGSEPCHWSDRGFFVSATERLTEWPPMRGTGSPARYLPLTLPAPP